MSFGSLAPAVPQIEDGKLRALAVTGKARWPTLANVPTMTEAGYPAVEGENWQAVLVPAGTPGDIITLLNREIVKVITLPDMKERLAALASSRAPAPPTTAPPRSRRKSRNGRRSFGRPASRRSDLHRRAVHAATCQRPPRIMRASAIRSTSIAPSVIIMLRWSRKKRSIGSSFDSPMPP